MAKSRRTVKEYSIDKRAVNTRHRRQRKKLYPRQQITDLLAVERYRIMARLEKELGPEYHLITYSIRSVPYGLEDIPKTVITYDTSYTSPLITLEYVVEDDIRLRSTFVHAAAIDKTKDVLDLDGKKRTWLGCNIPSSMQGVENRFSRYASQEEWNNFLNVMFQHNPYLTLLMNGFAVLPEHFSEEILFSAHTPLKWAKNRKPTYPVYGTVYKLHKDDGIWKPSEMVLFDVREGSDIQPYVCREHGLECPYHGVVQPIENNLVYHNSYISVVLRYRRDLLA